ncbi:MAG TPA: rod shape-determining protein RodA [Gammaproteobacteria bacterium]|nr:rod shape-determining protein RodA [Gammaproteobacteria bacterium]
MRQWLRRIRLDPLLLGLLLLLSAVGLIILFSASGQSEARMMRQLVRLALGFSILLAVARIPVNALFTWSPVVYLGGILFLVLVLLLGAEGKGAQRWLDLGFFRFQPSEIMKLATPMMVAFYFSERRLPPSWREVAVGLALAMAPAALVYFQPDLGTALLIAFSGAVVVFAAGIRWRTLVIAGVAALGAAPLLWRMMHDYQRQRVMVFLQPETDPLGAGYHIIQSKIALGSGGLFGKGWLEGSQAQLEFLPEQSTDFIFSVFGEEFGLIGALSLFALYLLITLRGLYIAWRAEETYSRLLAASLSMTFFIYFFVNVGMVSGLLPVVGVPLPLVSYGGTSIVTLMGGFGMLMAIQNQRGLLPHE